MSVITSLNDFTSQEREQLGVYSNSVIQYALERTINKPVENPFAYLKKICDVQTQWVKNNQVVASREVAEKEEYWRKKGTKTGRTQYVPSYMQPTKEERPEINPVQEYYRVEALRDTPKYKRAVEKLRYHPDNPFAKYMHELGLPLEVDPGILKRLKLAEILAHRDGSTKCEFNTHPAKECAFVELAKDDEYVKWIMAQNHVNDVQDQTITYQPMQLH